MRTGEPAEKPSAADRSAATGRVAPGARILLSVALLAGLVAAALASTAGAVDIPLVVDEPDGVSRTSEAISAGFPVPPGTASASWALFDGAVEIPVQVSSLQGQTPWILVDFSADIPASGQKQFTLRNAPSGVAPPAPLVISEDAARIVVTTGRYRFEIGKNPFNLLDGVWIDRNGDQAFDAVERVVTSSGNNLTTLDATTGTTFAGTGVPDRAEWEYRGPLRATLRVDGRYRSGSTEYFAYTSRLTFYAGQGRVRLEHTLRNSVQFNERPRKYRSALLRVGAGSVALRAVRTSSVYYANVGSGGLTFNVLPVTEFADAAGGDVDVDSNGGWVLPDLTHEGRTIVLDFEEGLSSTETGRRAAAVRSPLFALAPERWYSDYGDLSTLRFGTLDDEKQSYTRWGWTWSPSQEPDEPHIADYLVSWWPDIHGDSESDDLWQNLLMYLRTGIRGYWDRAQGWAWYQRHRYAFRTDGFAYAWDSDWEAGPHPEYKVSRPLIAIPLTGTDQSFLSGDVQRGQVDLRSYGADHMYGWGLLDYYHLTGDVDALEAATDLGEISWRTFQWRAIAPDNYVVSNYGVRDDARNLLLACHLYEVTGSTLGRNLMDHIALLLDTSTDWDPRGAYLGKRSGTDKLKTVSTFENGMLYQAMYSYFRLTGDTTMRGHLIQMADFGINYGLHATYQYTGYWIAMDYPNPGDVWHANFDDGGFSGFAPLFTETWLDGFAIAYRLTGDSRYLDRGKYYWDRASKAVYGNPFVRTAGPNEVGKFLNKYRAGSGAYFDQGGDLPYMNILFAETASSSGIPRDTIPPDPPIGLQAR